MIHFNGNGRPNGKAKLADTALQVEILDCQGGQQMHMAVPAPGWLPAEEVDLQLRIAAIAPRLRGVRHPVQILFRPVDVPAIAATEADSLVTITAKIDRTDSRQMQLVANFMNALSALAATKEAANSVPPLKARFEVVADEGWRLVIRDRCDGTCLSVTNNAEAVVRTLREAGHLTPGKRLFYYDTEGCLLDEIVWTEGEAGRFAVSFRPGNQL